MVAVLRILYFLSLIVIVCLFLWGGNKGFNRIDGIPVLAMICLYFLDRLGRPAWFPDVLRYSKWAIAGVLGFVFLPLAVGHILKHWALQTHGMDVAFVYSGLFYPFEWPPMWCTVCPNPTYFSEHFSPSLLLIAPLTALFKLPELIMILQSLIAALVVVLLLWQGPLRHNKSLWLLAMLYMISHRTFRDAMVFDFREEMMALGGFAVCLVALHRGKWLWSFVAFIVALGAKENICFLAPFVGAAVVLDRSLVMSRHRRWAMASLFTFTGFAWMLFTFKGAIPYFLDGQAHKHVLASRLPIPGFESSTASSIVGALLENPLAVLKYIIAQFLDGSRYKYLLFMLLPTLPFTYRAWPWLIPAFGALGMNFISANPTQRMMIFHYDLMVLPFLFFALLKGMEKTPLQHYNKFAPYMALWAMVVFGRPPLFYVGKYAGEAISNYRDHSYLSALPPGDITAASMGSLAQLVHLKDTRVFYLPVEPCGGDQNVFYSAFIEFNRPEHMRSSLPTAGIRRFVIDTSIAGENCLADVLMNRFHGKATEEKSPNGRFRVIQLINVNSLAVHP